MTNFPEDLSDATLKPYPMTYESPSHSPSVKEIALALSKAQGSMEGAQKGAVNPHFRSKYADLASVWDAIREALSKNGLAVTQLPSSEGQKVTVETFLIHTSGEWFSSSLTLTAVKGDPQAIGSAITYARRYSLMAMVGVSPEDDDGNQASLKQETKKDPMDGVYEGLPAQKKYVFERAKHHHISLENMPSLSDKLKGQPMAKLDEIIKIQANQILNA